MRLLLFSLVSTKIPHSPSHQITAVAVLKDIPQCLCRLSYIGVYRRSDSPRYSERRTRHFFALPSVSTKAAFFHAAQSSDRSPQRHPPPTRPIRAALSPPASNICDPNESRFLYIHHRPTDLIKSQSRDDPVTAH